MKYLINLSFLLLSSFCLSQQIVNGTVYDEFGNPIPGVNITVKSKPIGITTDFDGNFSIEVPSTNDVLIFSYVGLLTQEIEVLNKKSINVVLKADRLQWLIRKMQ